MTEPHRVLLSLGSNIDAERNLLSALYHLRARFPAVRDSPVYQTPALGFAGDDFLNLAVALGSDLAPEPLNDWLHALEDQHGRRRDQARYSARPLDIDIVLFDDLQMTGRGNLQLPRPELQHAFVLKPLFDLEPDRRVPGIGKRLADLWQVHPEHRAPRWNAAPRFLVPDQASMPAPSD